MVKAIQETILVLSQEFAEPELATQEELDNLVSKVKKIPEVAEIVTDESEFRDKLTTVLRNVAVFITTLVKEKQSEFGTNLRATGQKPVILIDGGKFY